VEFQDLSEKAQKYRGFQVGTFFQYAFQLVELGQYAQNIFTVKDRKCSLILIFRCFKQSVKDLPEIGHPLGSTLHLPENKLHNTFFQQLSLHHHSVALFDFFQDELAFLLYEAQVGMEQKGFHVFVVVRNMSVSSPAQSSLQRAQ